MSQFTDTLEYIKEGSLPKQKLEDYHKTLCELRGDMKLALADILKAKAMFMVNNPELSVAQRKINWSASAQGQREIELKADIGACNDAKENVKARLFSIY